MLVHIPQVLNPDQLAECRQVLAAAEWVDGRVTAGHAFAAVKHNRQVPAAHPAARRLGDLILTALDRTPLFLSAALPLKVVPPLFNRYEGGRDLRQPRRWRDLSGRRHAAPGPHRPVGDAVPERARKNTTAASW